MVPRVKQVLKEISRFPLTSLERFGPKICEGVTRKSGRLSSSGIAMATAAKKSSGNISTTQNTTTRKLGIRESSLIKGFQPTRDHRKPYRPHLSSDYGRDRFKRQHRGYHNFLDSDSEYERYDQ